LKKLNYFDFDHHRDKNYGKYFFHLKVITNFDHQPYRTFNILISVKNFLWYVTYINLNLVVVKIYELDHIPIKIIIQNHQFQDQ